jgi:hypothetical protein
MAWEEDIGILLFNHIFDRLYGRLVRKRYWADFFRARGKWFCGEGRRKLSRK